MKFTKIALALVLAVTSFTLPSHAVDLEWSFTGLVISATPTYSGGVLQYVTVVVYDIDTAYEWKIVCRRSATIDYCNNLDPMDSIVAWGDVTRPCTGTSTQNCAEFSVIGIL